MTTTTTTPIKKRFTSLPVPPPPSDDPTQVYDVQDFPDLSLFDETIVYPAISVPVQYTAHYKKLWSTIMVQGRKNVYPQHEQLSSTRDNNDKNTDAAVKKTMTASSNGQQQDDEIEPLNHNIAGSSGCKEAAAAAAERRSSNPQQPSSQQRRILLLNIGVDENHPLIQNAQPPPSHLDDVISKKNKKMHKNKEKSTTSSINNQQMIPTSDSSSMQHENSNSRDDDTSDNNNNTSSSSPQQHQPLIQWIPGGMPITTSYTDTTINSVDTILRKLLPSSIIKEVPSSFETVGHICHVNLRTECLPYKYWIGKVLLEYHTPTIRVVVNKLATLDDVTNDTPENSNHRIYRTFPMEILASNMDETTTTTDGRNDSSSSSSSWSITTVHEHGCSFTLDYQHVYWNSRLSGEHHRLVQLIQQQQQQPTNDDGAIVVADAMAGVGPFAVPLTSTIVNTNNNQPGRRRPLNKRPRKGEAEAASSTTTTRQPPTTITVYANDLNPTSYQYLQINQHQNKCCNLHCSNVDARQFLSELSQKVSVVHYIILNLPATAPEFLNALRGWPLQHRPTIFVYCFAPKVTSNHPKGTSSMAATTLGTAPTSHATSATSEVINADDVVEENDSTTTPCDAAKTTENNNPYQSVLDRCSSALGYPLDITRDYVDIHVVRDISPGKNMVCISFQLPAAVQALAPI